MDEQALGRLWADTSPPAQFGALHPLHRSRTRLCLPPTAQVLLFPLKYVLDSWHWPNFISDLEDRDGELEEMSAWCIFSQELLFHCL